MDELRAIEVYCEITGASEARGRAAYMFLMISYAELFDGAALRINVTAGEHVFSGAEGAYHPFGNGR